MPHSVVEKFFIQVKKEQIILPLLFIMYRQRGILYEEDYNATAINPTING